MQPAATPRPKVLVVDDNEQNRILVEETLRADGYDVVLATSGMEAVEVFPRERPDLVLLDVRMPGLDGFATCAKLRASPGGPETPLIPADRDLLRRVLENLVDNALRHAPAQGRIAISAEPEPPDAVLLRVADSGHGIPEALRSRIFERYVQVENRFTDTTRSGRGLGLAFCRMAVEAHGGSIWVDANQPGTVFCVRLPRVF